MKKIFLTAVAVLGFAAAGMAEDKDANTAKIKVNTARLSTYLNLSASQYDTVDEINAYFESQMEDANRVADDSKKAAKVRKAVMGNCKLMKENLTKEQYAKYLEVINVTLNNKGLNGYMK